MELRNLRLTMRHRLRFVEANASMVMPGNGNQSNVQALLKQNLIKKSMLLLVTLLIFTSVTLMAQSPQKINFQSIVRNTNGVIFSNKTLSFKISLLSGSITGAQVYSETHSSTTDAIGLVSLQIGSGTALSGSFATINWGNTAHFIKLEADFTGGNAYVTLGTQELMSVPYAMYAAKTDTASLNLTNRFAAKLNKSDFPSGNSPGEFMYWNGDFWTTLPRGQRGESIIIDQNGNPTWGCLIPSSAALPSTTPTIAVNKPMTPITIATTGVTGILQRNLPQGLEASWSANVITISGTPTQAYIFQYLFVLSVNCGQPLVVLGTIEVTPATVPDAPTGVVATAGNASASVAFVVPSNNGGSDITLYEVISEPPFTFFPGNGSGPTSPITVSGLTNATAYTFQVVAINDVGPSEPSAPSAAVTPAPAVTVPDAPTGVVATAGDGSASVAFVVPSNNGGSDITLYEVISEPPFTFFPGNGSGPTSPITVSGLTNGTAYTFRVFAINGVGPSNPSAPSAAVTPAPVCPTATISYNDYTYTTVGIGNQCWMAENLRTSKYSDGTAIPDETDNTNGWGQLTTGARSEYVAQDVPGGYYVSTYGYLYNWYAAKGIDAPLSGDIAKIIYKNICPTGWHVPTDSDWNKLVKSIHSASDTTGTETQSSTAGTFMKKDDAALWTTNTGTNSSGFSALPGGNRSFFNGGFFNIRGSAFFWSATETGLSFAWGRSLYGNNGDVGRKELHKGNGASVRCLKD